MLNNLFLSIKLTKLTDERSKITDERFLIADQTVTIC